MSAAACGWWWVLVGLLFEICIVDASIFATRPSSVLSVAVLVVYVCAGMPLIGVCWSCFFVSCFEWCRRHSVRSPLFCFCVFVGVACVVLTLLRQAMKGTWWMPWHQEPMKDVGACDKPWGVGNQAVIRGCPNGETQHESCRVTRI